VAVNIVAGIVQLGQALAVQVVQVESTLKVKVTPVQEEPASNRTKNLSEEASTLAL
jgi:hypothetical protein